MMMENFSRLNQYKERTTSGTTYCHTFYAEYFFVLVNDTNGKNFIYHIDVYQERTLLKNSTNAHIDHSVESLEMAL